MTNIVKFLPRAQRKQRELVNARVDKIVDESKRMTQLSNSFAHRAKLISRQQQSFSLLLVKACNLE